MQWRTITQDEFALLKQYRQLSHTEKIIVKRFLSGLLLMRKKKKSPSGQGWTKNATNGIVKRAAAPAAASKAQLLYHTRLAVATWQAFFIKVIEYS